MKTRRRRDLSSQKRAVRPPRASTQRRGAETTMGQALLVNKDHAFEIGICEAYEPAHSTVQNQKLSKPPADAIIMQVKA